MKLFSTFKILSFLILTLQVSCGYIENDNIDFQKTIIGNIKIHKQENSEDVNLVFSESDEMYAVIVDNCSKIYYNSVHKEIFVEKDSGTLYKIEIIDASAKRVSAALQKKVISKDEFLKKISNLEKIHL